MEWLASARHLYQLFPRLNIDSVSVAFLPPVRVMVTRQAIHTANQQQTEFRAHSSAESPPSKYDSNWSLEFSSDETDDTTTNV